MCHGNSFSTMTSMKAKLFTPKLVGCIFLVNLNENLLLDILYLKKWMGGEDFATRINRVTYISSEVVLHPNSGFVIAIQDDYATNAE